MISRKGEENKQLGKVKLLREQRNLFKRAIMMANDVQYL